MPLPPKVRTFASSPCIMVVTTYKQQGRSVRPPRRRLPMVAADETGTGAVPDMAEVMRLYRARNRGGRS